MSTSSLRTVGAGTVRVATHKFGNCLRVVGILAALASVPILSSHSQASTIVDLTTAGSSGTINGAIYQQIPAQATGTGNIDSFAQIGGNASTSRGYNTMANNVLNNGMPDNFNHSIPLGLVPTEILSTTLYRRFLLDVNESVGGGDELVSLDEIQIYVSGTANSSIATFTSGLLDHDGTLVYRMDAGMDNWIALSSSLNTGSGSGDMYLYVPDSVFSAFSGSSTVTLYSQFGLQAVNPSGFTGNFGTSGGFEEWAVEEVPEPASASLALIVLCGLCTLRQRS
jgi:hypothetical protein